MLRFKIGNRVVVLFDILNTEDVVIGLNSTSFTDDGKHIFMADLDNTSYEETLKEARRLMKELDHPHEMVFKSSENHYHIYSMTPLTYQELLGHVSESRSDMGHKMFLLHNKYLTLRITKSKSKKPINFVTELWNRGSEREVSHGGREMLLRMIGD